jgi:hypothetical protein
VSLKSSCLRVMFLLFSVVGAGYIGDDDGLLYPPTSSGTTTAGFEGMFTESLIYVFFEGEISRRVYLSVWQCRVVVLFSPTIRWPF